MLTAAGTTIDTFYTTFDNGNAMLNNAVSHFFCGVYNLKLQLESLANTGVYSFEFNDIDLENNEVNFGDTDTNGVIVDEIGFTCEMFTLRDSCNVDSNDVALDGIPTFSPANTDADFIVFPAASIFTDFTNVLGILQTTSTASTVIYTINYQSIENKGYEGAFRMNVLNPTTGSLGAFNYDIKIEAFGKVVVNERDEVFTAAFERKFALFNFDTTGNNQVIITFKTDYADSAGDL